LPSFTGAQTLAPQAGVYLEIATGMTYTEKNSKVEAQPLELAIPAMVYPSNGATEVPIVPRFTIKTVVGADRYELQVATDQSFFTVISYSYLPFLSPTTSEFPIDWFPAILRIQDFQNNSIYYWRVRALNTNTGEASAWSRPFQYTTTSSGPSLPQPSLLLPAANAVVPWLNIELIWNRITEASWYQIQWSTSSTFSSFTYDWKSGDSPSLKIAGKPSKSYYWRVVGFNDKSISVFSSTRIFQTGNQVTLTDPSGTFDDGSGIDDYENNLDIYWLLKPTNASKITLSFLSFDTESDYDYVTIYDGETTSSPVIGRFSGTSIPAPVTSSGGVMLVRFRSDASVTGPGWRAKYESTGGQTSEFWQRTSGPYGVSVVWSLAINSSGAIFAGTDAGPFRSTDNGTTWAKISTGLTNTDVRCVAINSSGHIFAGTGDGVFRSTDDGGSWTRVGLANTYVYALAINSSQHVFAGTWWSTGVFRSTDNGQNWAPLTVGMVGVGINAIAFNSSGHIFALSTSGILRSTDSGRTWSLVNTTISAASASAGLAISSSGHVLAGSYGSGVFRSTDNGNSWTQAGLTDRIIYSLAINSSGHIFAGTYGGVFHSLNNGESWSEVSSGLGGHDVRSFAINSKGYIFAGTYGGGVFRSVEPVGAPGSGRVILTEPLEIDQAEPYFVGQTLRATFSVENIGDRSITIDKLLVGGRYKGGKLPNGQYPDFSDQRVTLQPGATHSYEGTFTLPDAGQYDFFVAYYIQNPTEEEKKFLDENNWNTTIKLREGLTDADRRWSISVNDFVPPEASFTFTPENPKAGQWITFDASASQVADGKIVRYDWDWGNTGTIKDRTSNPKITYYWEAGGTKQVRLVVTSDRGATGEITKDVSVQSNSFWEKLWMILRRLGNDYRITEDELKLIKSERGLNIKNDPWTDCQRYKDDAVLFLVCWGGIDKSSNPGTDVDFSKVTDSDLKLALDKAIGEEASGLTYGIYILNAIKELNMIESVWTQDYRNSAASFFSEMLDKNVSWTSILSDLRDNLIEELIEDNLGPLPAVAYSTLRFSFQLKQLGISVSALEELFFYNALWYYLSERVGGMGHDEAWQEVSSSCVSGDYCLPPQYRRDKSKVTVLEDYFKRLWDTYGGLLKSKRFDNFRKDLRNNLRSILYSVLNRHKPELLNWQMIMPGSPIELRVYDSQGNVTGVVNGEAKDQIPYSVYGDENETIVVFNSTDSYRYQAVGTGAGTYGLSISSVKQGDYLPFSTSDIPISAKAVHQFRIDWSALSRGEKGISIDIDSDGDGVFEETLNTTQPNIPSNPWPQDKASGLPRDVELKWDGGDPQGQKQLTYLIHFGTSEPPPLRSTLGPFSAQQGTVTYNPGRLDSNTVYFWSVVARDNYGITTQSPIWTFTTGPVVTVEMVSPVIPASYTLHQNYPNPFNPSTTIEFALPKSAFVTLRVYDLLGRQVGELVSEKLGPGTYKTQWDARGLASGVYFYRLQAGEFVQTKKLLLLK